MRGTVLVLFLLIIAAVASLVIAEDNNVETNRVRPHFRLPKLFQFTIFKKLYSKTYSNLAEEARRAKLFFARAFKVFISAVKYRHKRDSKYLAINPMSDWTPKEVQALSHTPSQQTNPSESSLEEMPAADLGEIEDKLAEIVEHRGDNSDLSEIANELDQLSSENKRVKREDSSSIERQLSTDDLMPDPGKFPPEPTIDDNGNDLTMRPMTDAEVAQLNKQSGGNFLTRWFRLFLDFWHAINRDVAVPNLPDKVFLDLRDSNCITQIHNQYHCGSCYAFATLTLYEYHYCRQTKAREPTEFSVQYVIDCVYDLRDGCSGGFGTIASKFIETNGLELKQYYPYRAKSYRCPYRGIGKEKRNTVGLIKVKNTRLNHLSDLSRDKIARALEEHGVLYVSLYTNTDFVIYGGGVDKLEGCGVISRHAMVIVGHGREDGLEYWLIKNSFSTLWGQSGYYKLSKGVPWRCLSAVAYLDADFELNLEHDREFVERTIFQM